MSKDTQIRKSDNLTCGRSAAIIQSAAENLLRSSFSVQIVCHSSRGNLRFADHPGVIAFVAPLECLAGHSFGALLLIALWPTSLKAVQERREPLGPDSTPAGPEARSPHIMASMFRWDDWVSRIPEWEESAWRALRTVSFQPSCSHIVRSPAYRLAEWMANSGSIGRDS